MKNKIKRICKYYNFFIFFYHLKRDKANIEIENMKKQNKKLIFDDDDLIIRKEKEEDSLGQKHKFKKYYYEYNRNKSSSFVSQA